MVRGGVVRIYRRMCRKRYLGSKRVYRYERLYVPVPARFHEVVRPFLGRDLRVEVKSEGGLLLVTAAPVEEDPISRAHIK